MQFGEKGNVFFFKIEQILTSKGKLINYAKRNFLYIIYLLNTPDFINYFNKVLKFLKFLIFFEGIVQIKFFNASGI